MSLRFVAFAVSCTLWAAAPAWAWNPFLKNHPRVEEGTDAYEAGKHEDALKAYEDAQKALPNATQLWLNKGDALAKLGRLDEAKDAFSRAAELAGEPQLRARALYNLGNVFAEQGKREEAISAFRRSLRLNPYDEDARHNLEVMLRNLPPPSPSEPQPDGGSDGGQDGGSDGGADGGADGGQANDAGQKGGQQDGGGGPDSSGQPGDGGSQDGGGPPPQSEEGPPDAGRSDGGFEPQSAEEERGGPDGGGMAADLSEQEAQKLLDSMKQNEKNFQLWRFQKKKPRKSDGKDW